MKQEDFIPGRWYRSTAEANNRGGEIYYGKFLKFRNDAFVASSARVSGEIHDAKYIFSSGYIWELLTDLTEIQDLLPNNHPDKIMKTAPEVIMEVFGKFIIGNIVVSLRNNLHFREEGDMFTVLPKSKQDCLYYKPNTHSSDPGDWRLATTKECQAYHNGVKNIKQMSDPKETTKPVVSQFLKDDYIVTLQEISASFPKNHIFKQRETTDYLRVYKDIRGEANGNTIAKFTKTSLWRYATKQEIMEYDIQDRPVDAKKWAVKRTTENCVELNAWANSRDTSIIAHSKDTGWIHSISYGSMGHSGDGHYYGDKIKHPDHIEISFEQWKMDHLNAPKINIEPIKTNTMDLDKWYIELEFIDPNRDIIINYLNKKYNRCMTGSGGFYFVENGRFKCESKAPKDYYRISTEQFKRDIMKDKVTYNHVPKYVKCISYAQKHNGEIFCTDDPPPLTLIGDGSTWHQRLINMNRLNDGSFVPATREEYEAFITKNNKVVLPSYKDKSLGEMCDLCNQMFPIGSVVDFSNNGSDIYTIKEKLYIGSNSYVSYVGLPIVYRENEDTLRCSLVSKPVKTIEDLPKKAKMSDVSALVKHQEPIIVNRQKTKRSKLVIINK